MKRIIVYGAGGFMGTHLVEKLRREGNWVLGVDLKYPEFSETHANKFVIGDLRDPYVVTDTMFNGIDELYQLAADMGGSEYIFSGEHDADVVHNSVLINLNTAKEAVRRGVKKIFFSSSACIYPEHNQLDPNNPNCAEDTAYPAQPDSEYGWEKLFSERLYKSFYRNYGLDVRIARFHNIFGEKGSWNNGKEKAPAALCRKVAEADTFIEVFGDGKQTRSFLYIDECLEGVARLMFARRTYEPLNIGSEEMVTIDELAYMIMDIAGKRLEIKHKEGFTGVRGRCSDNNLIYTRLGWKPNYPLKKGLAITYDWIYKQIYG